jgi:hypothetical protein
MLISMAKTKYTILSSPLQLAFDEFNAIKEVRIRFMAENSFYTNDFMMLSFSEPLETSPGTVKFSLLDDFQK